MTGLPRSASRYRFGPTVGARKGPATPVVVVVGGVWESRVGSNGHCHRARRAAASVPRVDARQGARLRRGGAQRQADEPGRPPTSPVTARRARERSGNGAMCGRSTWAPTQRGPAAERPAWRQQTLTPTPRCRAGGPPASRGRWTRGELLSGQGRPRGHARTDTCPGGGSALPAHGAAAGPPPVGAGCSPPPGAARDLPPAPGTHCAASGAGPRGPCSRDVQVAPIGQWSGLQRTRLGHPEGGALQSGRGPQGAMGTQVGFDLWGLLPEWGWGGFCSPEETPLATSLLPAPEGGGSPPEDTR